MNSLEEEDLKKYRKEVGKWVKKIVRERKNDKKLLFLKIITFPFVKLFEWQYLIFHKKHKQISWHAS